MLDGKEMPDEWQTSVLVPIFKRKGDIKKLQHLQRSKAVRACHEDRSESAEEKNSRISKY